MDKLGNFEYCKSVAKFMRPQIYNIQMTKKLDNDEDILPIKNGYVLDFKSGIVRERTIEDYCTEEHDIDYTLGAACAKISNFSAYFKIRNKSL